MALKLKCIIILSTKSAGSSALQELICHFAGGRVTEHTRHGERETLYWTKAASVLHLPQLKLPDSEVPIEPSRAARDLKKFLSQNAPAFSIPADPHEMVFRGWHALAVQHAPVFVEKSPHHLHQSACLDLMARAVTLLPDIDFRFVGLVRNPMDVLYSAWTRWRTRPEQLQHHWRIAYENLERFKETMPDRLSIVRYEDLGTEPGTATRLLEQLELSTTLPGVDSFIHSSSRSKWRKDVRFGFRLDRTVSQTAERFGYAERDVLNENKPGWRIYSTVARAGHRLWKRPVATLRKKAHNR